MIRLLLALALLFGIEAGCQTAILFGVVRQEPMFYNKPTVRIPAMYGIVVGYGIGGNSSFQFVGVTGRFLPVVEDTFTVTGEATTNNSAIALATRRTTCFGIHVPINVNIFRTEFFGVYIGGNFGVMWGRSKFQYESPDENFIPHEPYPATDKAKIRAAPGGFHIGALYEFERWSPYAEVGFLYSGLKETPGVNAAWLTVQVGVLLTNSEKFRLE